MLSTKIALVADDDASTRLLVQKFLMRRGFDVRTARNGVEAVELLTDGDFAVIVLDLMMPVLDGYGVLAFLRERRPESVARVVVITAYPQPLSSDELGVSAVVSKPFTFDLLGAIVGEP